MKLQISVLLLVALIAVNAEVGTTTPFFRMLLPHYKYENDSYLQYSYFCYCNIQEKGKLEPTWRGHGLLVCYSHYETNANFPEGANNEGRADVTCRPVEWQYPQLDLGPEAMFFTSDTTGESFEVWAVSN